MVTFLRDPMVVPRMARTSTALSNADLATERANQALLTTTALEGGAIADARVDEATRQELARFHGIAPQPAYQPLSMRPPEVEVARTSVLRQPRVMQPAAPPQPAAMPQPAMPQQQPAAPQPTQMPQAQVPGAAAPMPQAAVPGAAQPMPQAQVPAPQNPAAQPAGAPSSPAAPPMGGQAAPPPGQGGAPAPAVAAPTRAGAGPNPVVAARSALLQGLGQRYAAIPGAGSAGLRMQMAEANRQLNVLQAVLQAAQTNPQQALLLMREHGIDVTPETQALITDAKIRQRALSAVTQANARFGPGPRTASQRAMFIEGALGGGAQPPGGAAPAPGGGFPQPAGLDPMGGRRIVGNELAGGSQEGGPGQMYYDTNVPTGDPNVGTLDQPRMMTQEGLGAMTAIRPFDVPWRQGEAPQPGGIAGGGGGGGGVAAPAGRAAQGTTPMQYEAARERFLRGLPEAVRSSPDAASAAMRAFDARVAGDYATFEAEMRRAVGGGEPNAVAPPQPDVLDQVWNWMGSFLRGGQPANPAAGAQPGAEPGLGGADPDNGFVPPGTDPVPARPTVRGMGNGARRIEGFDEEPDPNAAPEEPLDPSNAYGEVPNVLFEGGLPYRFSGQFTREGRPIYLSPSGQPVTPE